MSTQTAQRPLTTAQATFVAQYLVDANGSAAARAAYPKLKTPSSHAAHLLAMPHIRAAIESRRYETQAETALTAPAAVRRLLAIADRLSTPPAAAVSAIMGAARICGLIVERSESVHQVQHVMQAWARLTDAELIAIIERERLAIAESTPTDTVAIADVAPVTEGEYVELHASDMQIDGDEQDRIANKERARIRREKQKQARKKNK